MAPTQNQSCQTIEMYKSNEARANTLEKINELLEEQIQSQNEEVDEYKKEVEYWKNYRFTKNKINQTIATKRASEYV